ncbi:MAG: PGPGW domain-containing protein [Deltaproteobacteria bacterium]|nr:PGPGW domain-containing protein [Deltaproteobacteria bacterium]
MSGHVRKILVLVFGLTLLVLGIAMIVLPGPAFVVIPLSLVVLGTEFLWARRMLAGLKKGAHQIKSTIKTRRERFKWWRKSNS